MIGTKVRITSMLEIGKKVRVANNYKNRKLEIKKKKKIRRSYEQ